MNKVLFVVVILLGGAFALSFGSAGTPFAGPKVIAKAGFVNQTAPIPTTTLITVAETGLYRASCYLSMTTPAQGSGEWVLALNWTDSAGVETYQLSQIFESSVPPVDYGFSDGGSHCDMVFKAVAGTPISYYTYGAASGTYEVSLALERLE